MKISFRHLIIITLLLLSVSSFSQVQNIDKSIDNNSTINKLRQWQNDKFGMFIHWGLYSIPAGVWNGQQIPFYAEQIMNHARIPLNEYEQLSKQFNPKNWNADSVVKLAKDAGMRYIVFTTKHHDGFCMFKTKTTSYNVVDATPLGRDVLMELATACKKYDMKLGLYYSLPDWHFPDGIPRIERDTVSSCTEYVNQLYSPLEIITPKLEKYIVKQITELLTNYGPVETIWFDMGLVNEYQSKLFRNVVKSLQPDCLINGRIMNNEGDYMTLPDNGNVSGYSNIAWDNPASMYSTWGYRSWQKRIDIDSQCNAQIHRLMQTISHGGVFLLNIGPDENGNVIDYEKNVLHKIGKFINCNSDAIYNTGPSPFDKLDNACCTKKDNKLYFTIFDTTQFIDCHNITSKITNSYYLSNPNYPVKYQIIDQGIRIFNNLQKKITSLPETIVLEFADKNISVDHEYINPDNNNKFILTEQNAITHAAFDSKSYMSIQLDSWKSWFISIKKTGDYDVFAIYTPEYDDKSYSFECDTEKLTSILPGVDRMMQTSYAGTIMLKTGKKQFTLESANKNNTLEPLGLKIDRILLIPSSHKNHNVIE